MKKFLRNATMLLIGFVFGAVGLYGLAAVSAPVTLFTGPAGSNPVVGIPATLPDLNQLIVNLNAAIAPTGLFSASSFQVGGSASGTGLTLGTVQPQTPFTLGSTTAKGFITAVDSQGKNFYIPFWE